MFRSAFAFVLSCFLLVSCGDFTAPDATTTGVNHPSGGGASGTAAPAVEAKSSALKEPQIWYPANYGGPMYNQPYTDCQGKKWYWRQFIFQYKTFPNGQTKRWVSFAAANNWPGETDYTKNEISLQCSEDLQQVNNTNTLDFPYKASPTRPDITCDLYSHQVGANWTHSVRTTIPWSLSYYSPITSAFPIGYWDVYLHFPPSGSPDWGTGYGTSCWATSTGTNHQFPISP